MIWICATLFQVLTKLFKLWLMKNITLVVYLDLYSIILKFWQHLPLMFLWLMSCSCVWDCKAFIRLYQWSKGINVENLLVLLWVSRAEGIVLPTLKELLWLWSCTFSFSFFFGWQFLMATSNALRMKTSNQTLLILLDQKFSILI